MTPTRPLPAADAALDPATAFDARFLAPLMVGSALNPINSSLIATALLPISRAFHVNAGRTAVLVAALYVASAIAQPTMGRLADYFGPRRVFLGGLFVILLGGIVGGLAQSLDVLIVARVLIGIGTSAGYPTAIVLIRRRAERAGIPAPSGALGGISIAGQVTAALGLPLGGLLVGALGWRSTFLINVPTTLIALAMTLAWVPRDAPSRARRSLRGIAADLDVAGLALFGATISALLVFLLSLRHPTWVALAIALVAAVGLVAWERRQAAPFFDVRMLAANRPLTSTYLRMAGTSLGMYLMLYGVTQWVQDGKGLSATSAGLVMLPMTGLGAVASLVVSRRDAIRGPLRVGAVAAVVVSLGLLATRISSPIEVVVALTFVFGLTTGLSFVGNQSALYAQTTPAQSGSAAGLLRTATYGGAILSSSVISLIYGADGVTDAGLHGIALVLIAVNVAVLLGTFLDRSLPVRIARG